jgi:hypothetical protein
MAIRALSQLRSDCERASSELDARTSYAASIIEAVYVEWVCWCLRCSTAFQCAADLLRAVSGDHAEATVGEGRVNAGRLGAPHGGSAVPSLPDNSGWGVSSEGLSQQEKSRSTCSWYVSSRRGRLTLRTRL